MCSYNLNIFYQLHQMQPGKHIMRRKDILIRNKDK